MTAASAGLRGLRRKARPRTAAGKAGAVRAGCLKAAPHPRVFIALRTFLNRREKICPAVFSGRGSFSFLRGDIRQGGRIRAAGCSPELMNSRKVRL